MTSYTSVGALRLTVLPKSRAVEPFDRYVWILHFPPFFSLADVQFMFFFKSFDSRPCEFRVVATLDVADLIGGASEALKAINNVDTHFHPMRFDFSIPGSSQKFEADQTGQTHVFAFGAEKRDGKIGISLPLIVLVPRDMWPAHPGEEVQFRIGASVVVEFVHRAQGNRSERVSRTAETTCTVRCQ